MPEYNKINIEGEIPMMQREFTLIHDYGLEDIVGDVYGYEDEYYECKIGIYKKQNKQTEFLLVDIKFKKNFLLQPGLSIAGGNVALTYTMPLILCDKDIETFQEYFIAANELYNAAKKLIKDNL